MSHSIPALSKDEAETVRSLCDSNYALYLHSKD